MRSILKKVASHDKSVPKADVEKKNTLLEQEKKDVLPSQPEVKTEQPTPIAPVIPATPPPEVTEEPQVKGHISHSRPVPHSDMAHTKPSVTPKELERMMRVTGNDVPS